MALLDKTTQHDAQGISLQGTFENNQAITFALNMIKDDHTGGMPSYQSEPGNQFVRFIPNGYSIVGFINGKDDEIYLFSTNGTLSEIGIFKQDKYTSIVNTNLGFNKEYPITGEYRVKNGCDDIIYWCDHLNPDRWFNFSKPDDFKTGINWDTSKFSFNPEINPINIDLVGVNNSGGNLFSGSYYFQIEVLDKNQNVILKSDITPQTPIYADSDAPFNEIKGSVNYPQFDINAGGKVATNNSITLRFSNLNTSFKYIRVNVIYQTTANTVVEAHVVNTLIPISNNSLTWTYTGYNVSSGDYPIDYSGLLVPLNTYDSSYVMEQINNRLVRGNIKGKDRDYTNFQSFTESAVLKWCASEVKTKEKVLGNPKSPDTYWYKTTAQGDEIYAIGIQYLHTDGSWSPVFHKSGRVSTNFDTDFLLVVANGSLLGINEVWLSDVEHLDQSEFQIWNNGYLGSTISRWKVFNTASITTSQTTTHPYEWEGEFGYWESDQVYPDIKDCDDNFIFGNLQGQKIRHFKFPDRKLISHITNSEYMVPLGIKCTLTTLPPDTIGFRLCVAERTEENKTVTDSGYLTRTQHYSFADPVLDELFLTAMEMDFFEDSANSTILPFRGATYGRFTSSNILYKESLTNVDYFKFNKIFRFKSPDLIGGIYPYFQVDIEDPASFDAKLYSIIMPMSYEEQSDITRINYKTENSIFYPVGIDTIHPDNKIVQSNDWFTPNSITKTVFPIENSELIIPGQSFGTSPTVDEAFLNANNFYVYKKVNTKPYGDLFNLSYKYLHLNPCYTNSVVSYNFDTLLVEQKAFRSLVLPQADLTVSVDRFAHVTYWVDRWEEQTFNSSLRLSGESIEFQSYTDNKGDYHNIFKLVDKPVDTFKPYIMKEDFNRVKESYRINKDYNKQNLSSIKISLNRDYDYCSSCLNLYPNRIIFSPVSFREEIEDKYRTNLTNDYIEIPGHRGAIKGLKFRNNMLFVHCDDGTFILQPNPQVVATDQSQAYLTTGDFLGIPAQELQQTDLGFAGCQSKQAYITNEFQHNWIDQKRGQVFGYDNDLKIISDIGLTQWFKENLPSNTVNQVYQVYGTTVYPTSTIPDYGFGVHVYFDPRYKRLIISKIDRTAIGAITSTNRTGMFFNGTTWDYYENGLGITSNVPTSDVRRYENNSWTISYDFRYNRWVSWHSYIPYISFSDNKHFYSLSQLNKNYIYKHLHYNSYHTYYGNAYDAIIDYQTFDIQTDKLTSVHYQGYTFIWDTINKQWLEHNETFNKMICYNHNQSTGLQNIVLLSKNNPYANTVISGITKYVIKTDQNYKISGLYDMAVAQPVMSQKWDDVQLYGSYIDKVPVNINFNKNIYQAGKLSDKYVNTRLFFKPVTDSKIIILLSQIQEQYSIR